MTATRPPRSSPGFSLLEMLIATAISAIVVAAGVALLMGQQRMYQSSAGERGLQETARIALGEMQTTLRLAGFGVDPPLTFDFGLAANQTMAQAPVVAGLTVRTSPPYLCAAPVACRDSIAGSDEIVFYSRGPLFGHTVTSVASGTAIGISGPLRAPLYKGQILQLMCSGNAMSWAYVTVGAYVAPTAGPAEVPVTLTTGPGGALLDFPYQQGLLEDINHSSCFKDGTAMVARVDRYRYFIGTFDSNGVAQAAQTPGTRPYLMLDKGLSDENDVPAQPTLIAPDVEDLQFSYVFPLLVPAVIGATPGTAIAAGPAGIDLAPLAGSPGYGTPTDTNGIVTASRLTTHPANIRAVRVSVVVRSASADAAVPDAFVPASANRPAIPGLPNFRRLRVETTVVMPNLDNRAPYFPILSSTNGADLLNVGGG